MAALSEIAPNWKQQKCPILGEELNEPVPWNTNLQYKGMHTNKKERNNLERVKGHHGK